ncbi:MAG: cytochrome-c peroxidase [Aureispira sp.]|nr:cytochrome-c peroxidase [Aureispira sp.]
MKKLKLLLSTAICLVIFQNCKKEKTYPDPTPYSMEVPSYFPILDIPEENPMTVEGIALGRRLYYDPIMDKNGVNSCSSCHNTASAFTTASSNSLAHINLAWGKYFLWNGKVEGSLEDIMQFEVDVFFQTDLSKLEASEELKDMFGAAFGSNLISSENAAKALAQFARLLTSKDSKYDKAITPQSWVYLNDSEQRGYDIFFSEKGDCFHCHGGPLFTDGLFHNNGLDSSPSSGREGITKNNLDQGKYKTPTLRNVELTMPYMHDGRFQTLEEVIEFYSTGLKSSTTVDPLMKNVERGGLQLNSQEKSDLLNFLKTLTDTTFTNNPALSNPL